MFRERSPSCSCDQVYCGRCLTGQKEPGYAPGATKNWCWCNTNGYDCTYDGFPPEYACNFVDGGDDHVSYNDSNENYNDEDDIGSPDAETDGASSSSNNSSLFATDSQWFYVIVIGGSSVVLLFLHMMRRAFVYKISQAMTTPPMPSVPPMASNCSCSVLCANDTQDLPHAEIALTSTPSVQEVIVIRSDPLERL